MRICNIEVQRSGDKIRLSGLIGGEKLWFESGAEHELFPNMDAFVSAALIPAMYVNEDIYIDADLPVSELLLKNLDQAQAILALWFPVLTKINIHATNFNKCARNQAAGVASFFSGGVDGTYTFLRHAEEITHLVFVEGIDIQLDNTTGLREASERNLKYISSKGKQLVLIRSNIRKFLTDKGFTWNIADAAGLSAIAHALSFRKMFIAGTHSALGLFPWGSHPLLDYLFSSESVEIIHDSVEVRRVDKIEKISSDKDALRMLRVCWHDGEYNCGKCGKCLRTMITLRLIKKETSTFPDIDLIQSIKSLRFYNESQHLFLEENIELAHESSDVELQNALVKLKKQHVARQALVDLDATWFGGRCKKAFKTIFS